MISTTLVALVTADELSVLLEVGGPAEAVTLMVRPAEAVCAFRLWNDLPVTGVADGVIVEVGSVSEHRQILLDFEVPAELDLASVCEFELRWVDGATERIARWPCKPIRMGSGPTSPACLPSVPRDGAGSHTRAKKPGGAPQCLVD